MADIATVHTRAGLDELFLASMERPVVLVKHSERCGASRAKLQELREFAGRPESDAALFALVEVRSTRDLSDEITARTGITHESPQVIVLRDGHVAWHASHRSISTDHLADALAPTGHGR